MVNERTESKQGKAGSAAGGEARGRMAAAASGGRKVAGTRPAVGINAGASTYKGHGVDDDNGVSSMNHASKSASRDATSDRTPRTESVRANPGVKVDAKQPAAAYGGKVKATSNHASRSSRQLPGSDHPVHHADTTSTKASAHVADRVFDRPTRHTDVVHKKAVTQQTTAYDEYGIPPEPSCKPAQPRRLRIHSEFDDSGATRRKNNPSRQQEAELYEEEHIHVPGSGRRGDKRHDTRVLGVVNLLLLSAILLLIGIGVWRTLEYRALAEMKAVVARQTFYPGTTVDGADVSAMTLNQAIDYWEQQIEPRYRDVSVTLDDGTSVTANQLGYTSDYKNVLTRAWNADRRGSLRERYLRSSTLSAQDYNITRSACDEAVVRKFAAWVASQVDTPAQSARLSGFNSDTYEFEFVPETTGYSLDQAALARDVEAAINAGGGNVERLIVTQAPSVTLEDLSSRYGMITSATTDASSSSNNRLSNIRLAMSIINGTCLHPGEQFSFNETVGERSEQRGFKMATAYSRGTVTEEVGGGICQVSTTLFNAAVKADLKIDERHPHSLTVSYVDLGKDAAVDWSTKDLKFTNNSEGDIYILCRVGDDKRLYIGIFGLLLPDGEYITVEGVKTGEVNFETRYQLSFELFSGQTRELQKGKPGYTAEAYKIRWDAQDNELSRELLCRSRYSSTPEIIEYAP